MCIKTTNVPTLPISGPYLNDDEEFDDGVDGNCGEFVADVEEGTFVVDV